MTLDEAIKHAEEIAEENEKVYKTGIMEDGEDGFYLADVYADDTEIIEGIRERCKKCAEEHRQLAEWLKDYKRLKEKETTAKPDWMIKNRNAQQFKTNRDVLISRLRKNEEKAIYYNVDCPYIEGDKRAECETEKRKTYEICVKCKTKWLNSSPDPE